MRVDDLRKKRGVAARRMPNITEEERFVLRAAFDAGLDTKAAAERIGRSRYTASRHYAIFRGEPYKHDGTPKRRAPKRPEPKPLINPSRFYKSEFVPT